MGTENHPVWTVYDKLRTARLNVKYYGRRLTTLERTNFWMEVALGVTAPSSAIAGLWFWNYPAGDFAWKIFAVAAAIVSVVKPLMGLTKKIKEFESVLSGYRILEHDLLELKALIEQEQKYSPSLQAEFRKTMSRERTLVGKTPESSELISLRAICQAEVLKELPATSFFIPN